MKTIKLEFPNASGQMLSAKLEMPVDKRPMAFALFAHCFTCSKNLMAVTHISRGLAAKGIAVLRFDFTGLGDSEGDFADTNFSSNVEDLVVAAEYLRVRYEAPKILVGHSLGGAAVLIAASKLSYIEAVATVGAPADPPHIKHLLSNSLEEIEDSGKANLSLGGRPFTIKKQFIDDLEHYEKSEGIKNLGKPLLILHSPQDEIVDIQNAEKIYTRAKHPKSYVSLDGADHLLTVKKDAIYVGEIIASWAKRYIPIQTTTDLQTDSQVVVRNEKENGLLTEVLANGHYLISDEPTEVGGTDLGGTPYDLLVAALGTCTAITIRMYANHKGIDLHEVKIHLSREKRHATDATDLNESSKVEFIDRELELTGNLTEEQRNRILQIADRCPVHRTLAKGLRVNSKLKQ